jgi:two-component system, NarL family, sensor histidine kinase UhpB
VSLRLRLLVSIGLGLLASLAFGGGFAFWDAARQVEIEMRAAIAAGERIAQTAVDDSNQEADRQKRLQRLIMEFDGNRHIQAFLIDRNNVVLLASTLAPPNDSVPHWFRRLIDRGTQMIRIELPKEYGTYQAVEIATDASNEAAEKWGEIVLALIVLVAFCIFVLGLVYCALAIGLRPLRDLNAALSRVGKGDYSIRIAENGPTELARLTREFNQMVFRLSAMKRQNDHLNEQLGNVQEEERADVARELHDEIGPFLFAAGLDICAMQQMLRADEGNSARIASRLEALRGAITHMQKHIKMILGRLRPTVLLDFGLSQGLETLIDFWKSRRPDVVFSLVVCPGSFGEKLEQGVYRIVRESLNNALRHGRPTEIDIRVRLENNTLAVDVVDDGGGLETGADADIGFGIIGMKERAALLGGTLSVQNRRDRKGVAVSVRLPCGATPGDLKRDVVQALSA